MPPIKYEIYRREAGQPRPGLLSFVVNGQESEIAVDPAQFMKKSLREAIEEGITDPALQASRASEISEEYAKRALERRIERLKKGQLYTEGFTFGRRGLETPRVPFKGRVREQKAVEAFLNRGRLKGLTKEQRKERFALLGKTYDCEADWKERRLALIEDRKQQIADLEAKIAGIDPGSSSENAKLFSRYEAKLQYLRDELAALQAPIMAASHGFQVAYVGYLSGTHDLVNDDIRIFPLMTNTTADTERDSITTFSDLTTVDEFDGANYSSGGLALDSQAVAVDDANDRAEFDAADETVSSLGAGTRSIQGVGLGSFNTNTAGSALLHWLEFASNKTPDGSDFTFQFDTEGILQMADG